MGFGEPDHLNEIAGLNERVVNGIRDSTRAAGFRAEEVDVLGRALNQTMGNQGIATGKCETVCSGGIERDPGDTSLERVNRHLQRVSRH